MSISGLFIGALRRWKLSMVVVAVFVVGAVLIALLMKPVYRAEAIVAPAGDGQSMGGLAGLAGQLGGIAALAGMPFGAAENRAEALGVLRSRLLIEELITGRNLMPILFHEKWDAGKKRWTPGVTPPTMGDAYLLFSRRILQIREDLKSGLIIVRIEWRDPKLCAEWAGAVVELANEEMRRRTIQETGAALAVLEKQYETAVSVSLRTAISNLVEAQLRSRTLAEVRKEFAFKIVDPPVVPDLNKRVRPTRTLIVIIGGFLGGLFAILLATFLDTRDRLWAAIRSPAPPLSR